MSKKLATNIWLIYKFNRLASMYSFPQQHVKMLSCYSLKFNQVNYTNEKECLEHAKFALDIVKPDIKFDLTHSVSIYVRNYYRKLYRKVCMKLRTANDDL